MTNKFDLLKNGNVATTVWANPTTKEIYPANRNSYGYNAIASYRGEFYDKYGKKMKRNQGRSDSSQFTWSEKSMNEAGFVLVKRGEMPLF